MYAMESKAANGDGENDLAVLAVEIERSRSELNLLGERLGAMHPDVLAKSQQLDELIHQHIRVQVRRKKPTA
jgi:ribosomal 50S subunit-associated protein YjgA (DUF615 family)